MMVPVPTDRRPAGPIPLRARRGIRVVAGALFVVTGLAKIPVLDGVSFVICTATGWPEWVGRWSSWIVIGAEVTTGAFLLSGIATRLASTAGGVLTLIFAGALGSLLLRGMEIDCHCFGVLGLNLPIWGECLLDLLLFSAFFFLRRISPAERGWTLLRGAAVAGAIILVSLPLSRTPARTEQENDRERRLLQTIGGREYPLPRLLLVIDYRSLSCSLCFDDLVALCDSLTSLGGGGWGRTLTILRWDLPPEERGSFIPERWARETGIGGALRVAEGAQVDPITGGESLAILLKPGGGREFAGSFPLGRGKREELLSLMVEKRSPGGVTLRPASP
jgi:hypothetical protein